MGSLQSANVAHRAEMGYYKCRGFVALESLHFILKNLDIKLQISLFELELTSLLWISSFFGNFGGSHRVFAKADRRATWRTKKIKKQSCQIFTMTAKFSRAHWLIFIVNKRTDT